MIRKNPRGDIPQVHESAFVDPTAILCGMIIVHENVFIGPLVFMFLPPSVLAPKLI